MVHSAALEGFWPRPTWLWEDPSPNPLRGLAEIVGPDTIIDALRGARSESQEA